MRSNLNECGHVPAHLYWQKQVVGQVWPGCSLLIPGLKTAGLDWTWGVTCPGRDRLSYSGRGLGLAGHGHVRRCQPGPG